MASKVDVQAYVDPEIKSAIKLLYKEEDRSESKMIEILLREALVARGIKFTTDETDSDSKNESARM